MRCITRIHLSDCGWHEAYYPGTTIELADPRTGEPRHTMFSLENTGGKTSFLALVLSCFDPSERRFLKTLIRPTQKFGDYFGGVPAFILVEWDLSGGQTSLLDAQRLITGQLVVPRGERRRRELDRHFFSFRSAPGLALDNIPAPGLPGFEEHGRLNGHQDVQRWLYTMRSSYPGNFQNFAKQTDWKRKLAEEKIDTELLAAQVEFNRSEGGIEDFLNFRSESQFVRKFLAMTVPETEAGPVRAVLAEHVGRLADLPRLERRRDAMHKLKEKFAPFVEIARGVQAAEEEVSRRIGHAASLKAALEERGVSASRRAEELSERAGAHETTAGQAEAACSSARVEFACAMVEMARGRHVAAKALAATREDELAKAESRAHLLQAAVLMREILDDHARIESLQEAIDAEHADLQPRREALTGMGADLKATLDRRAAAMREQQRSLTTDAAALMEAARKAEEQRAANDESAQAERRTIAGIDVNLGHAREFRMQLEEDGILQSGESAKMASRRHAEAARAARDKAQELRRQSEEKNEAIRAHRECQSNLKAERSGIASQIGSLQETVREGDEKRRSLAFDSTILELTGDSKVDPESKAVERVLADAKDKGAVKLRESERRQELFEADRESLEATGLASIDKNVRAVTERLHSSGMADAQPYATYLSAIVRSPDGVRRFAELDPARFAGVAVPNRKALDAARQVLQSPPPLSRPVSVVIASDVPGESPGDRFVLAVEEPAAYDREAARELQRRIGDELGRIAESNDAVQRKLQRLESTLWSLDTWRERFGDGQLDAMRQSIERKVARNEKIGAELAAVSNRIETDERDARLCRDQARECDKQAHSRTYRARRARDHHAQWESRVEDWQVERLRHEKAAQAAEVRARERQTKRDALKDKARKLGRDAADAANQAADMEREAGRIEYTAAGGRISESLDNLRRDYKLHLEALKNIEKKRVGDMRGQRRAIEQALNEKEDRFVQEFGKLDRAEVEAEAARDGVREAAASANADLDTARTNASTARANADSVEKEFRGERDRYAAEIKPESLADLRAHGLDDLAGIAARAEETIIRQRTFAEREKKAAERTRHEAAESERAAKEYTSWAKTLDRLLHSESVSPERIELPRHEEVETLVNDSVSGLVQARADLNEAQHRVYKSYEQIRKFINTPTFSSLQGEREVAVHLSESDPLASAVHELRTAGLIDDRLKSIKHDLSRLDDDLQACIEELDHLLRASLHIVRRMVRDGRIPKHVPRFGGQPVFRMGADLSRIAATQRREILRRYIIDLVEVDRVPERGQDIAAELVERMKAALGRSTFDIRLLKPKGEGDTEHMPIERVTVSGGELLTAAMMIYLVIARLRADAMHKGTGEAGVLILDNPLGKANKALLLQTQIGLADAMGIQLFYATGVQDTSALAAFENIVRLRRNRQSRATRRIHVEIEAMHTHIDKDTDDEASAPALAGQATD